ncbi:uncharacterized protein [Dipodomys merriami]|uniref:uncharacterized protein n=1 Tax=Dipodomys merriami TaxID=94247 RepID=UPI003855C0B4
MAAYGTNRKKFLIPHLSKDGTRLPFLHHSDYGNAGTAQLVSTRKLRMRWQSTLEVTMLFWERRCFFPPRRGLVAVDSPPVQVFLLTARSTGGMNQNAFAVVHLGYTLRKGGGWILHGSCGQLCRDSSNLPGPQRSVLIHAHLSCLPIDSGFSWSPKALMTVENRLRRKKNKLKIQEGQNGGKKRPPYPDDTGHQQFEVHRKTPG